MPDGNVPFARREDFCTVMISNFLLISDSTRWLLALGGAVLIAGGAYRLRALSGSGMIAAIVLGASIVGLAGWWAGFLLITFFLSSSLLSRVRRNHVSVHAARGSRRDAVQVMANGGVALLCAAAYQSAEHPAWLLALAGSVAAANADTWSTEIGRTSRTLPRLITTGRQVPGGTSGAVSARGLVAAALGAALISLLAGIGAEANWFPISQSWAMSLIVVGTAGLAGSVVDSILGATVQEQRWCDVCEQQTERRIHGCGTPTRPLSGVLRISNDAVNLACVFSGGVLGLGIGWFVA